MRIEVSIDETEITKLVLYYVETNILPNGFRIESAVAKAYGGYVVKLHSATADDELPGPPPEHWTIGLPERPLGPA